MTVFLSILSILNYLYICLSIDQRWYQWWCSPPNKDQDIKKNVIYLEGITIWPLAFNHPMISIYQLLPSTVLLNYPIAPKHEKLHLLKNNADNVYKYSNYHTTTHLCQNNNFEKHNLRTIKILVRKFASEVYKHVIDIC